MTRVRVEQVTPGSNLTLLGTTTSSNTEWYYGDSSYSRCVDSVHKGPPYLSGGNLSIKKSSLVRSPSGVFVKGGLLPVNTRFIVNYWSSQANFGEESNLPVWSTDLSVVGSEGFKKFRPGNAQANIGQAVAELRDIPTLPLRKILKNFKLLKAFKDLGSEYLNVEFGWKPFVKDLQDMERLTSNLDKQLAQLRRDNGQSVRRHGKVRTSEGVSTVTNTVVPVLYPTLHSAHYQDSLGRGRRDVTIRTSTDAWFSASFRYFVENIESPQWDLRARAALYGALPTPSLLYEVLPWSWLIDWGINVGTVLSNMSMNAVDNQVASYAFVMEHRVESTHVNERTNLLLNASTPVSYSADGVSTLETKTRTIASPYGFGVVPGDLSDRQALILSALGISRRW